MILLRVLTPSGSSSWGYVDDPADPHATVSLISNDSETWPGWHAPTSGETLPLASAQLLAPASPSKIVAVAKNYAEHAREMGSEAPSSPMLFFKTPNTIVGPGHPIILPRWASEVHYEGELAVIIGQRAKDLNPQEALTVIGGLTCANDVSARDAQRSDGQWARAKGFDTSCPIGPWIVPFDEDLAASTPITTRIGERIVQQGTTADMITDVAHLVAYASQAFTLEAGDVLLTGTPAGVGPLEAGDVVGVTIEGIGTLTNPVAAAGSTKACHR